MGRVVLPKMTEEELEAAVGLWNGTARGVRDPGYGLRRGEKAYCLHCECEIEVSAVLDDPSGDWCPTAGCDGAGWGFDLFPEMWWQ